VALQFGVVAIKNIFKNWSFHFFSSYVGGKLCNEWHWHCSQNADIDSRDRHKSHTVFYVFSPLAADTNFN